jgi:hypothetical protein
MAGGVGGLEVLAWQLHRRPLGRRLGGSCVLAAAGVVDWRLGSGGRAELVHWGRGATCAKQSPSVLEVGLGRAGGSDVALGWRTGGRAVVVEGSSDRAS